MDVAAYLDARDQLAAVGRPFTALLAAVAAGLVVARTPALHRAVPPPLDPVLRRWPVLTLGVLAAGFLLLARYHLAVWRSVALVDPATGQELVRVAPPLWIEGEKLYFWALLLAAVLVATERAYPHLAPYAYPALAALIAADLATGNPFTSPLPRLHQEVMEYRELLLAADPATAATFTQLMYLRVTGFYNSSYMWVHPPLLFASYAALVPAFLASLLAWPERPERARWLDTSLWYTRLGYLALTVGLVLGYPWARAAWRDLPWWWDPKVNMSIMMWVLYTAFLHACLRRHRPGMARLAAAIGAGAFASVLVTYLTTYVIPGVHSYR